MKNGKRLICIVCALVLTAMIPVTAYAAATYTYWGPKELFGRLIAGATVTARTNGAVGLTKSVQFNICQGSSRVYESPTKASAIGNPVAATTTTNYVGSAYNVKLAHFAWYYMGNNNMDKQKWAAEITGMQ